MPSYAALSSRLCLLLVLVTFICGFFTPQAGAFVTIKAPSELAAANPPFTSAFITFGDTARLTAVIPNSLVVPINPTEGRFPAPPSFSFLHSDLTSHLVISAGTLN